MLVYKTWRILKRISYDETPYHREYLWEGWFLFGIIPLYLKRTEIDD